MSAGGQGRQRVRRALKGAVEVALDASGAAALLRRRLRGRDLVLAYHGIVPDGEVRADASGHLGVSAFAAQMRELARVARVVPLHALDTPPAAKEGPRVAITFDDGYAGALRHAVPVLVDLGLPATFFVCPDLIGGEPFWWDWRGLDVWSQAGELLERRQGRREQVIPALVAAGCSPDGIPADARPADLAAVQEAAARPGISIGSHTMRHPNLASLDEAGIRRELEDSKSWLAARVPSFVPWVAYPYGLADPRVERIAREAGYVGGFVLDGGWIPAARARRFALPRLNIASGVTRRGFRLRLSDIFAR